MVRWLSDIGRPDTKQVGTKAANLGTLFSGDADVPRGFCIEHDQLESQLKQAGVLQRINRVTRRLDRDDWSAVSDAAQRIHGIIHDTDFESAFAEEIESAYENINLSQKVRNAGDKAVELVGGQRETDFVAVRPSTLEYGYATPEIGINGKNSVLEAIKDVIASAYAADALYHEAEDIPAIVIQKMVDADLSCTIFTRNPLTGEDEIIIEAVYGLGLGITRGDCNADRFYIDRSTGRLNDKEIATKRNQYSKNPATGSLEQSTVPKRKQDERTCDADMLSDIVNTALDIASRLDDPLRIDLSVGRNKSFILDAREPQIKQSEDDPIEATSPLLSGETASPGYAEGKATTKRMRTLPEDNHIFIESGTDQTRLTPISEASGMVTDTGLIAARTSSHARRHGTPLIIETGNATSSIDDGTYIRLDGATGMVYGQGNTEPSVEDTAVQQESRTRVPATATKLFALDEPIARADGVVEDHAGRLIMRSDNNRLTATDVGDDESRGLLINDYASILTIQQAVKNGTDHVILDIDRLQSQHDAVAEAISTACNQASCSLLMRHLDKNILEAAVANAVEAVIVPSEQFDSVEKHLARIERRYLLDKLRSQDHEHD